MHSVDPRDPWDFQEVYGLLHELARAYAFRPESERYLIHITTGTHVAQICMFLLTEARYFPASLLQSSPGRRSSTTIGTCSNRDLREEVRHGRFREDLLARINLWTFRLPALRDRPEDIEPNIDYELERHARLSSATVRFNAEARAAYVRFATSPDAEWTGNFRELSASVSRMATLADGGRIGEMLVEEEIERLRAAWQPAIDNALGDLFRAGELETLDLFDRLQLEAVIAVCRRSNSLADAGRKLFAATRSRRSTLNDSDRLRKYLARFDLDWARIGDLRS